MSVQGEAAAQTNQTDAYFCEVPSDPCAIVLFGASGDLAQRKLLPALFDLARHGCLAPRFRLLGFARSPLSDDDFRGKAADAMKKTSGGSDDHAKDFLKNIHYFQGDYDDPDSFEKLSDRLEELDRSGNLGGNRLFYLDAAGSLSTRNRAFGKCGSGTVEERQIVGADHCGKAVWARSGFCTRVECEGAERIRGEAGLPHRSLSRQRDGAKYAGFSFRQRHF